MSSDVYPWADDIITLCKFIDSIILTTGVGKGATVSKLSLYWLSEYFSVIYKGWLATTPDLVWSAYELSIWYSTNVVVQSTTSKSPLYS